YRCRAVGMLARPAAPWSTNGFVVAGIRSSLARDSSAGCVWPGATDVPQPLQNLASGLSSAPHLRQNIVLLRGRYARSAANWAIEMMPPAAMAQYPRHVAHQPAPATSCAIGANITKSNI